MVRWKKMSLTGWGRSNSAIVEACRPERVSDVAAAVRAAGPGGILAYGQGQSCGDVALNDGGRAVLPLKMGRILEFDEKRGEVTCEAGVVVGELMAVVLARGFMLPVVPGTGNVSIGGAIANDVHGKNQDREGNFGDHLAWVELVVASGKVVRIGPHLDRELFLGTVAGMGLTGIILRACIRLMRVPSGSLDVTDYRLSDLAALLAKLEEVRGRHAYVTGWLDALATGSALGRGIVSIADFSPHNKPARRKRVFKVPFDFPEFTVNPLSGRLFQALMYHRVPRQGRQRSVEVDTFLCPLDTVQNWNRIYGRRGMIQIQCVISAKNAHDALKAMLVASHRSRSHAFLSVLRTMGREGAGMLSFSRHGFSLSLDFPGHQGSDALMTELVAIVLDHGGRIFVAKDSTLSAAGFAAMYPNLDRFRVLLDKVDPDAVFRSDLERRLDIRKGVE